MTEAEIYKELALNCKLDDIVEIVTDIGNNITGRFDG